MLRITPSVESTTTTTTLTVEGRLERTGIGEFRRACQPFLGRPSDLVIDLSAVAYLDDEGVAVVRDLIRRGIQVRGCSPLLNGLLEETNE